MRQLLIAFTGLVIMRPVLVHKLLEFSTVLPVLPLLVSRPLLGPFHFLLAFVAQLVGLVTSLFQPQGVLLEVLLGLLPLCGQEGLEPADVCLPGV
jgi:hypothetical protein